jgi:two-component system OmpR family sensor kinase
MLDRLQEALRRRQASEERLRQFVADAGHELRTPLTTIQGFAQLALRGGDLPTADRTEADRLIAQNAERMTMLVDDLLLLTMLDEKPVHRREQVDLLAVAAETISATSSRHHDRPVSLHPLSGQGDLESVVVTGDAHRLRQVATNLLDNALTHPAPGTSVEVRVGLAMSGPAGGGTDRPGRSGGSPPLPEGLPVGVLEVSDDGPGLQADEAGRVFERFYRVDRARARDRGGAGLGLAIASTIAADHGGRLEVDTEAGSGCTFRLVLPIGGGRPADREQHP